MYIIWVYCPKTATWSHSVYFKRLHQLWQTKPVQVLHKCSTDHLLTANNHYYLVLEKIISVHSGFYTPGGTQMFGKFKDLHSCQKACDLTPTCFSGDFNPWLGKCYIHSNLTACDSMRSHKAITHFKKIPCSKFNLIWDMLYINICILMTLRVTSTCM